MTRSIAEPTTAPTNPSNDPSNAATGTTTGVVGQRWRGTVTPWGDVHPWSGSIDARPVRWFVAADDRWHVPADETAVRQHRVQGVPVLETRVRVPDGDAVQRVWSVADAGGLTVIEIENDSSRPFAVAFSGGGLLTERPPSDVPIRGIELPDDTIVLPVGHRSSLRVAIAHVATQGTLALPALAPVAAVVNGWLTVCERASRLQLPDAAMVEAVVKARCDLLLDGPVDADDDPLGFLFDVAQLIWLGDGADAWLPEIVEPVARIARVDDPRVDAALVALERLALSAGDRRAADDLAALGAQRRRDGIGVESLAVDTDRSMESHGTFLDRTERTCASGGDLLPAGIPTAWLGANFEVHGIPTSARSTVSYAVRWHGDRPAALWEQSGVPVTLTASSLDPQWSTSAPTGEVLWRPVDALSRLETPTRFPGTGDPGDGSVSFG